MNRIDKKFKELRKKKEKALITFFTAGDPSLKQNEEVLEALESNGADVVEIGVPFSDPLADGPVIQASSERALKRGINLKAILALVARVRKKSGIPIILMGYFNPFFHYGIARFAKEAAKAGVDGLIIPDLPHEEARDVTRELNKYSIYLIHLVAPTSTKARLRSNARSSRGFIYYVSVAGVTGVKKALSAAIAQNVRSIRKLTKTPVCVGFGVSSPQIARDVSGVADGVIVGSALVRQYHVNRGLSGKAFAERYVAPFARAIGKRV